MAKVAKYKMLVILVMAGLILPSLGSASSSQLISPPETLEEVKTIGMKTLRLFPESLKKVWQEALGIWQKMWDWFNINILVKIQSLFGKEVEKRKPIIEKEFKKEKEEMKEELPKVTKSLWERFKELIK